MEMKGKVKHFFTPWGKDKEGAVRVDGVYGIVDDKVLDFLRPQDREKYLLYGILPEGFDLLRNVEGEVIVGVYKEE